MPTEPPSAAVEGGQETGEFNSDLHVLALQRSHATTEKVICSWVFTDVVLATEPQSGVNAPKKPHASQEKQQVCRFFNSKRGKWCCFIEHPP
jgi:hypothetical protein